MTKTLIFFIATWFLIYSCNNPTTTEDNIDAKDSVDNKADVSKLNDALKKYEDPSQVFKVSAYKPSVITGKRGTKISINPNDLVKESGKPLGENIEVELRELTNQGQLLRSNAQTVSEGKLLISGGAYFIGMTSDGEQLKLKDNKTLGVQFPKLENKEMTLFYGQRNDLGQMNWQKSTENFKTTQQLRPTKDSMVTIRKNRKSEIDAVLDYVKGDTTTEEGRKEVAQWKTETKVESKLYDEIEIARLGWINCDRFLEVENKTDLYVNLNQAGAIRNVYIFLVFTDINSIIQTCYYAGKMPRFQDLPVGYKARLIAYTVEDERVYAYSTDFIISKGQNLTLNLREISDTGFRKLISN